MSDVAQFIKNLGSLVGGALLLLGGLFLLGFLFTAPKRTTFGTSTLLGGYLFTMEKGGVLDTAVGLAIGAAVGGALAAAIHGLQWLKKKLAPPKADSLEALLAKRHTSGGEPSK